MDSFITMGYALGRRRVFGGHTERATGDLVMEKDANQLKKVTK